MSTPHPMLSETLLGMAQAALRIPPYRGRRTNVSTIFRWITDGVKLPSGRQLKLEGIRLAGRWLTSTEAIDRFLTAQNDAWNPDPAGSPAAASRTPTARRRSSEDASKRLQEAGL